MTTPPTPPTPRELMPQPRITPKMERYPRDNLVAVSTWIPSTIHTRIQKAAERGALAARRTLGDPDQAYEPHMYEDELAYLIRVGLAAAHGE